MLPESTAHAVLVVDEPTRNVLEDVLWEVTSRALPSEDLRSWIFQQGDRLRDEPGDVDSLGDRCEQLVAAACTITNTHTQLLHLRGARTSASA